jgi:hypothetical protein
MRYRLRTLAALTAIVPPLFAAVCLGGGWIVLSLATYVGLVAMTKRFVFSDRPTANRT